MNRALADSSEPQTPIVKVVCLSPFSEEKVRGLFPRECRLRVVIVPTGQNIDRFRRELIDANIIIGDLYQSHRLDERTIQTMERCQLIQFPSAGFDSVDAEAAARMEITVANLGGYNKDAVADWTVMAILCLIRRSVWGDRQMRQGKWPETEMLGRDLAALNIGIIGFGNIGTAVANRLLGFGCKISFYDEVQRTFDGAVPATLQQVISESDVVTLHVPLTKATRHIIDAPAIAAMRPGALIVNTSRGQAVDELALVEALSSGRLGGAALDVFATEPPASDSPLRLMENVIMSPHIAGYTQDAEERMELMMRDNISRVLRGTKPNFIVNGVC